MNECDLIIVRVDVLDHLGLGSRRHTCFSGISVLVGDHALSKFAALGPLRKFALVEELLNPPDRNVNDVNGGIDCHGNCCRNP